MKKQIIGLLFILISVVSFAQRQRTTAQFDADTTTRPKVGFYGIGVRSNVPFLVPRTGNNVRIATIVTNPTNNFITRWNGTLVNSRIFDDGTNVGIGTTTPDTYSQGGSGGFVSFSGSNPRLNIVTTNESGVNLLSFGTTTIRRAGIGSVDGSRLEFYTNTTNVGTGISTKMAIVSNGNVGIGTTSPTTRLDVNGVTQSTSFRLSGNNTAPASSSATCTTGEIRIDANFIYYCTATNTWKRATLNTF